MLLVFFEDGLYEAHKTKYSQQNYVDAKHCSSILGKEGLVSVLQLCLVASAGGTLNSCKPAQEGGLLEPHYKELGPVCRAV